MARTGRPPKPVEVKRATGRAPGRDSGGRKLPDAAKVVALPMANGTPDPPEDLGLEGRELWAKAWGAAITWLSPDTDMTAVVSACRLADDLEVSRRRFRATSDPADARAVATFVKALHEALAVLGFDPTARSRLGVAEVKRVSALEELARRRRS